MVVIKLELVTGCILLLTGRGLKRLNLKEFSEWEFREYFVGAQEWHYTVSF